MERVRGEGETHIRHELQGRARATRRQGQRTKRGAERGTKRGAERAFECDREGLGSIKHAQGRPGSVGRPAAG